MHMQTFYTYTCSRTAVRDSALIATQNDCSSFAACLNSCIGKWRISTRRGRGSLLLRLSDSVGSRPKPVVEPSHRVRNIPCDLHYEDRGVLSAGVEILIGSSTAAALP